MSKVKVLSYRPTYIKGYGIDNVATVIACGMNNEKIKSDIFSISSEFKSSSKNIKNAYSLFLYKILSKVLSSQTISRLVDKKFIKMVKSYDVAYLWPGCSVEVFRQLKQKQKKIIIECVNCHQQVAKTILDEESVRLKGMQTHAISEVDIRDENEKLMLADFIFSPSPQVTASLKKMQVADHKIIETSYGLDHNDFLDEQRSIEADEVNSPFTALFVGSVIPRKGIHLLLDYWQAAGVDGKLKVIGKLEPTAETIVEPYQDDPSIEFISFTNDLTSHYKNADLFIMPSLEEGSPLVTYLAMGAGLPCLVSPMAGEGVVRDGMDGYILPPHDKDAWVAMIQRLAKDELLRSKMGLSSRQRAEDFLWLKVAQKRAVEMLDKLGTN